MARGRPCRRARARGPGPALPRPPCRGHMASFPRGIAEARPIRLPNDAIRGSGKGTGLARSGTDRRGRHDLPRIANQRLELVPVDLDVQVHAEPAPVTDVRRPEEAVRRRPDQCLLGARRRGEPGGTPVVVMAIGGRDELALPDEPARLAVAQPLGSFRQAEADRAEPAVWIACQIARIRLFLASWVSSALPSASSSGGRYIPNRPR